MIRFEHPELLYALGLVPLLVLLFWYRRFKQKKALKTWGDMALVKQLMPDFSFAKQRTKAILFMLSFFFLLIALANPQVGTTIDTAKREGVDIMIALDISNSMLAEDIQPNRLERARQAIFKLIDDLDNDRLGIVIFAGKAFTQLPITTDYGAAKLFTSTIHPRLISSQGTAIGEAIRLSMSSLENKTKKKDKAIILISDGENHEDDAVEATKEAEEKGIIVHTIGMGLPEGAPIPIGANRFKTDQQGHTVISKLNEPMLQEIAQLSGGIYIRATNANIGLSQVLKEIKGMEKSESKSTLYTDYESRFQYFLGLSLLFLLIEMLLFERKSKLAQRIHLFKPSNIETHV